MYTWEYLKSMAEKFKLDGEKFELLESFFAGLDPEFFRHCAELVTGDFPVEAVKERF